VRLKDDTSADAVADLLASTHTAAFGKNSPDTNINLYVTLSWTLHGTSIKTTYDCAGRPDLLRTARQDLTTAGEAKTIDNTTSHLGIDYGQVTAIPTSFPQPGTPASSKSFTLNGWQVTSTSNQHGQFPTTVSFEQVIAAAKQASPTGSIDLTSDTLSVTGAVVGEMTMGGTGLGMVLSHQRDTIDTLKAQVDLYRDWWRLAANNASRLNAELSQKEVNADQITALESILRAVTATTYGRARMYSHDLWALPNGTVVRDEAGRAWTRIDDEDGGVWATPTRDDTLSSNDLAEETTAWMAWVADK